MNFYKPTMSGDNTRHHHNIAPELTSSKIFWCENLAQQCSQATAPNNPPNRNTTNPKGHPKHRPDGRNMCTINSVTRAASKKTRGHMRDQIRMQRHTHTRTHTGRRTESTAAPNNARGHATKSCCPNRRMPTRREKLNKGQRTRPCSGLRRLLYVGACLPCIPVGSCRSAASTPMARNCDCNSTPSISPAKNLSRIARNPTGQASGCNSRTSGSV